MSLLNKRSSNPTPSGSMISLFIMLLMWGMVLFPTSIFAQGMFPNQRDDSYPLLGLKRAKSVYERSKAEFQRIDRLHKQALASEQEWQTARATYVDAEVNYQQSLLVLLFEKQFVSVKQAIKFQDTSGKKKVRILLENTSGTPAEFATLLAESSDSLFKDLNLGHIYNVYVSLSNDDEAIISRPYEQKITQLSFGTPQELEFELLQDVDALTVNIIYGNGSSRNPKVFLQKDDAANRVLMQSEQFAQEVPLNSSAVYRFNLELFSSEEDTYRLEVFNLPKEIERYFEDATTEARLSYIQFNETTPTRSAQFRIFLPDRPSKHLPIDSALTFYVAALSKEQFNQPIFRSKDTISSSYLDSLNIGYLTLQVTPTGVGELIVKAPQRYNVATIGEPHVLRYTVRNEGSQTLRNIEFDLDIPLGWEKSLTPEFVPELGIREEQEINLTLSPPSTSPVGKYEVRLRTTSISNNRPLSADTKTFVLELEAEPSYWGSTLLLGLLLLFGGGIVWFGIHLSKK